MKATTTERGIHLAPDTDRDREALARIIDAGTLAVIGWGRDADTMAPIHCEIGADEDD